MGFIWRRCESWGTLLCLLVPGASAGEGGGAAGQHDGGGGVHERHGHQVVLLRHRQVQGAVGREALQPHRHHVHPIDR